MKRTLLQVLGCPRCHGALVCTALDEQGDEIERGSLQCERCHTTHPIERGIPRFVPADNYAASFGYQWNRFRREQLDSANGTGLSRARFYAETGWPEAWMAGKWILDAGCGAGRFLDVVAGTGAEVVGLDLSSAVEAVRDNLRGRPGVHCVQASIYEMPFREGVFDAAYSIGVIQHTPDPLGAVAALAWPLKAGGRVAYTIYEKRRFTPLYAKYLLRPLTRRLGQRTLLRVIQAAMPLLFPISEIAFRIPLAKRVLRFLLPVANYVEDGLLLRQRYAWAVMDTFDMLAPRYDQPQTERDVVATMRAAGFDDVRRTPAAGLNVVGRRRAG